MGFNLMITGKQGSFLAQPGYQLASVRPDKPDVPVPVGTATGAGPYNLFSLTDTGLPDVKQKLFWRPGIFFKSGNSSIASADVGLDVALDHSGQWLGKRTIEMNPFNNNLDTYIWPVTPFFATSGPVDVKAAITVMNSINNKLQTRLFIRSGNDRQAPGSQWAVMESSWKAVASGNSERNSGTGPLGADRFWAQIGLGVRTTSASSESRATLHVACHTVGS